MGNSSISVSPPILPDRIWHHRVHEELGETLCFWRLGFEQIYLRDSAEAGLRAALGRCQVKSVAVYEMLGVYDLLVRVWLPDGCHPAAFDLALAEELGPHGLETREAFLVDYSASHWAFGDNGAAREPTRPDIMRLFRDRERLERIDRNDDVHYKEIQALKDQYLLAVPDFPDDERPGIKFAIVISGDSLDGADPPLPAGNGAGVPTLSPEDQRSFEERVNAIVRAADTVAHRSLYAGSGFGHFLLLGRIGYEQFHDINAKLVSQLVAAPVRERFSARTTTLVSAQRGLRLFSESLTTSPWVARTSSGGSVPRPDRERSELEVGELFAGDRFEIVEPLGDGGFGYVYRVSDHREGKVHRALKIFAADSGAAAQRELSMLRKVQHPNVVTMFWSDRDPETGWWYLVSEFVDGHPLEEYVRGRKAGELTEMLSVEIVRQILLGLEGVHPSDGRLAELAAIAEQRELTPMEWEDWQELKENALVHRDIKPANVMITPSTRVKLIDFNIASQAGELKETEAQTSRYYPPGGWPDRTWKPQVDIYATGVVLYELLCDGEHPYPHGAGPCVDPREHRPSLTDEQAAVVARACSPGDCFLTAVTMREALERAWRGL